MNFKLSIVIPVYHSENTISRVVGDIFKQLDDILLEIILVNDGSRDNSSQVCLDLVSRYKFRVKFIELAKNFSEHNAVMAGLNHVSGEHIAIMDDDSQNPPAEIRKLIEEIQKGFDIVYSYYEKKEHSFWRNIGSRFNDKIANIMLNKPSELYLSSFKIIKRFIADEIVKCPNPFPYLDGLIFQLTDNIGKVKVEHEKRTTGQSNYTLQKLISLWMTMFTNFSILPLRLAGFIGFLISIIGFLLGIALIIEKYINPEVPLGFTSTIIVVLVFGGIQFIILGIIGEYLGRLFLSVNKKPQFVIRRKVGWE